MKKPKNLPPAQIAGYEDDPRARLFREIGTKSLELISLRLTKYIEKEKRNMNKKTGKKLAIALGVTAAVVATLVPYKVEKEEPTEEKKETKVKLRAIAYALDLAVTPDKALDLTFRSPGIGNINLINVDKHIDLSRPESEFVEGGEEIATEDEAENMLASDEECSDECAEENSDECAEEPTETADGEIAE